MSIDYGEKERQFLATLKADTGRDLGEWMAAITAENLAHRNDIIDWLRQQGFMFSKASWIERIHNNGGRPIYAGAGAKRPRAVRRRTPSGPLQPSAPAAAAPLPPARTVPADRNLPTPPAPAPEPASDAAALDALIARAKAYRPLAAYVVAEIRKAIPDVTAEVRDDHIAFRAAGRDFALLAISQRELRLGIALDGDPPPAAKLEPARFPATLRGAAQVSHMVVLTDARQITPALLSAISQAAKAT